MKYGLYTHNRASSSSTVLARQLDGPMALGIDGVGTIHYSAGDYEYRLVSPYGPPSALKYEFRELFEREWKLVRDGVEVSPTVEEGCAGKLALAKREADRWQEASRHAADEADYYRGLVDRIGGLLGPEAFTADDGRVHDTVLRAKVPELVGQLVARAAGGC